MLREKEKAVESGQKELCMTCFTAEPPVDATADVFDWIKCEKWKAWHQKYCVGFDIPNR